MPSYWEDSHSRSVIACTIAQSRDGDDRRELLLARDTLCGTPPG